MKPSEANVYCANMSCPSRAAGRTFKVIDTTGLSAAVRAELMIDGVDTFRTIGGRRVQVSWAKPRYDGELTDGEPWLCPDCTTEAAR